MDPYFSARCLSSGRQDSVLLDFCCSNPRTCSNRRIKMSRDRLLGVRRVSVTAIAVGLACMIWAPRLRSQDLTFSRSDYAATGIAPYQVAACDFDGDGKTDLA